MAEDKSQHKKDKILAAVVIAILCVVSVLTFTMDSKFIRTKESANNCKK
jgi:hypothetical protein